MHGVAPLRVSAKCIKRQADQKHAHIGANVCPSTCLSECFFYAYIVFYHLYLSGRTTVALPPAYIERLFSVIGADPNDSNRENKVAV